MTQFIPWPLPVAHPLTAEQCIHWSFVAKLGTFFHVHAYFGWPWGGVLSSPRPRPPRGQRGFMDACGEYEEEK
jgi:hypothetical protein